MTIRTIEVGVARKVSANYNSTEFSVRLTADLEPGEDEAAVTAEMRALAVHRVREGFQALGREPGAVG
jgi:hypothetical protein